MPLPFFLGAAAAIAAAGGVGSGIHGAVKMKDANDTMKSAEQHHRRNIEKFDEMNKVANKAMDQLGILELQILKSFEEFSDVIEKIQNRPQFKEYNKEGVELPKYEKEELKKVSIGAGILLSGLKGGTVGVAGGFAAAGATTSAVMALGTASTGTAIASLTGAAATNATLAALGGGAIAAGGGGIALGTTLLGATTLGVGLLVGGIIFSASGEKMSSQANEAWNQMREAEKKINSACEYLGELKAIAIKYEKSVLAVYNTYKEIFSYLSYTVNILAKTDWNDFSKSEKMTTQNTILLVKLLYKMCQVNLVKKSEDESRMNAVNHVVINESIQNSNQVMSKLEY